MVDRSLSAPRASDAPRFKDRQRPLKYGLTQVTLLLAVSCLIPSARSGLAQEQSIAGARHSRPNIVFVYTDDQAAWAFGEAVRRGLYDHVPAAHTPYMDQLARDGALLVNNFCTTPVCSPARASLMTGRYASEFGIYDFIPHPEHKLYDPQHQVGLDPQDSVTFAELLQQSGYATGLVGKWHLGEWTEGGDPKYHPTRHGFDYFMGLTSGGTSPSDPILEQDGKIAKRTGLTIDLLTDAALEFIRGHQKEPFLLCLHTRAPHKAWLPVAPEDLHPYEDLDPVIPAFPDLNIKQIKQFMREYLASVSSVDRNLGRILSLLDQLQLSQHTIVIYSADHGYNMGHNGIWHKGNGIWALNSPPTGSINQVRVISDKYRPNLYDQSLRVPTVIRWPGTVKPGTVVQQTTTSLDFFPTLAAMAGASVPRDQPLRGRNLVPLLTGHTPQDWDNDLYAQYNMINYASADMHCYRTSEWKLIRDFANQGRDELYHLSEDPAESVNLINDPGRQSVISQLDAQLQERMRVIEYRRSPYGGADAGR